MTIEIQLTPDIASFVSTQLSSGSFRSESELVCAALTLMKEQEEQRREIDHGIDQANRKEYGTRSIDEIIELGRQRLAQQ